MSNQLPAESTENVGRKHLLSNLFLIVLIILYLVVTLSSAVFTPLLADDLQVAFSSGKTLDQSWFQQVQNGLSTYGSGGHFNIVGQIFSFLSMKMWAEVSVAAGLDLLWGFWAQKFLVYVLVLLSMAWFVVRINPRVTFLTAFVITSVLFGGLIQIHTPWSNDPVTNFVIGFACVPFALFAIFRSLEAISKSTLKNYTLAAGAILLSVLVYEINAAVIPAVGIAILFDFARKIFQGGERKSTLALGLKNSMWLVFVPAFSVLVFRSLAPARVQVYEGTAVSGDIFSFAETLRTGVTSVVPTIAWADSVYVVGGLFVNQSANYLSLLAVFLIGMIVICLRGRKDFQNELSRQFDSSKILSLVIVSISTYGLAVVAIQASTVKIQLEVSQPGSVYTFYAPAFVSFVLVTAFVLLRSRTIAVFILIWVAAILPIQVNANWMLNNWLNANFTLNSRITYLATNLGSDDKNCNALENWLEIPFPEYYKKSIYEDINTFSMTINGSRFCSRNLDVN